MRYGPYPTAARLGILPTIMALLLSACGGGGGGDASAPVPTAAPTPTPAPAPAATTTTTPPPPVNSTALKDNTASAGADFSNFASGKVSIPVDSVAFVGQRRFVKVARADGATLFLGEVAPGMPFSITVDAPNGQRRFNYEIFSESASDAIVRGEVSL